jgi:hypothetical protein
LQRKVNANGRPSLTTENEDFLLKCTDFCFILYYK